MHRIHGFKQHPEHNVDDETEKQDDIVGKAIDMWNSSLDNEDITSKVT